MKNSLKNRNTIFIILLIGLFALISISLSLLGTHVYKTTSATLASDEYVKIATYFTSKVRQCPDKSRIRTATINGENPALVIGDTANGKERETWLYYEDHSLKEIRVLQGENADPLQSQKVMDIDSVDFEIVDNNLLIITITTPHNYHSAINLNLVGRHSDD